LPTGCREGESFRACQHQAVGDDERQEDTESGVQPGQPGREREFDRRDQRGDQQDEHRDTDLGG